MSRKSVLLLFLVFAGRSLEAATYVPMPDGELVEQAELIAAVRVESIALAPEPAGSVATDYTVRVERLLKGESAEVLTVRVPGGELPDGTRLKVWGAPSFRTGERALLFLARTGDGAYAPLHLMLGAFHEVETEGRRLALRDLGEAHALPVSGGAEEAEPVRDFDRFADWVAERAAGRRVPAGYRVPPGTLPPASSKHTLLPHTGSSPVRWFEFDTGGSVLWLTHESGQRGLAGGGVAPFKAALRAWSDDPSTNVRCVHTGTTRAATGFRHQGDGINAVLFGDPNGEIAGTYLCKGGLLATAYVRWRLRSMPYEGQDYYPIFETDIITQDGIECLFTRPAIKAGALLARIFAHELGHTLGLGHSCGDRESGPCDSPVKDQAVMRSSIALDGRGAVLNVDDRTGLSYLYSAAGGGAGAPSGLRVVNVSRTSAVLAWTDNSTDETVFVVELKSGSRFIQAGSVAANRTTATISNMKPGRTYVFRVRAKSPGGLSGPSNEVTVTTPRPRAQNGMSSSSGP